MPILVLFAGHTMAKKTIKKNGIGVKKEYLVSKGQTIVIGSIKATLKEIGVHRLELDPKTGFGGDELRADFSLVNGNESKGISLSDRPGISSMKTWGGYTFQLNGGDYNKVTLIVNKLEFGREFAVSEEDSVIIDGLKLEVKEVIRRMEKDGKGDWKSGKLYANVLLKKDKKEGSIIIDEGKTGDWNGYKITFVGATDQGTIIKAEKN